MGSGVTALTLYEHPGHAIYTSVCVFKCRLLRQKREQDGEFMSFITGQRGSSRPSLEKLLLKPVSFSCSVAKQICLAFLLHCLIVILLAAYAASKAHKPLVRELSYFLRCYRSIKDRSNSRKFLAVISASLRFQ